MGENKLKKSRRISVEVPEALARELDEGWPDWFCSRSEAVREGIRLVLEKVSQVPRASA